jgi:glycerophosphoryl diester phosphodiesterase
VDAKFVEAAHARCLHVHPYTVNEEHEMKALIELGVDGKFTIFPDRLANTLGKGATDSKAAAQRAAEASAACRARFSGPT